MNEEISAQSIEQNISRDCHINHITWKFDCDVSCYQQHAKNECLREFEDEKGSPSLMVLCVFGRKYAEKQKKMLEEQKKKEEQERKDRFREEQKRKLKEFSSGGRSSMGSKSLDMGDLLSKSLMTSQTQQNPNMVQAPGIHYPHGK